MTEVRIDVKLPLRARIKQRVVQVGAETALRFQSLTSSNAARARQTQSLLAFLRRVTPVSTDRGLIRLGSDGDGGYLLPDDMDGVRTCFSPGVSTTADFEVALAERNINCYLADYSVAGAPADHPLIHFEKKYLGDHDDSIYVTLADWVARNAPPDDNDLILQMDIEGDEYAVLLDASSAVLRRFRIIIIEFHYLDGLFSPIGFRLISSAFAKLSRDFTVVHIHPNNYVRAIRSGSITIPPVMEFTFLRNDRIARAAPSGAFPHPLDRRNNPHDSELTLPACWISAS